MPIWLGILIQLALRFGLPWLENHLPKDVAALIEKILGWLKGQPDQTKALKELHGCFGDFCKTGN